MNVSVVIKCKEKEPIIIASIALLPNDNEKIVESIECFVDIINFSLALSKLMLVSPLDKYHVFAEPFIMEFIQKITFVNEFPKRIGDTIGKFSVGSATEILKNHFKNINFKNDDFEIYVEVK